MMIIRLDLALRPPKDTLYFYKSPKDARGRKSLI